MKNKVSFLARKNYQLNIKKSIQFCQHLKEHKFKYNKVAVISLAKHITPCTFHPLLSRGKQDYERVGEAST